MNSPGIIHGARLKIVNAPMRLTSNILTVIVCSTSVWYESNYDYSHPMNSFYVWSFASRSFVASQFQNHHHSRYLSDGWRSQCAFLRFLPAIHCMLISTLILNKYSLTSELVLIQLLYLDFHDVPWATFKMSTMCMRSERRVMKFDARMNAA